ncbi:hypothetical protein COHA_000381 [Chlorella ohadii]|uniref:Peptidase S1 domain-containing protein n=1 Tax=Chlorella ohadii TaxID=2649997 RepID=A0AAD5E157_9CHLO|nr:hypothetical protein COHA_000381 [Chlorella ohadii]
MPVPRRSAVLLLLLTIAACTAAGRQLSASTALRAQAPRGSNRTASASGAPTAAIVNGWNAPAGRYRYMASLRRTSAAGSNANSHFCGGTLIHRSVVLTAAHCVMNFDTGFPWPDYENRPWVRIGGYNREYDASTAYELRSTVFTVAHPKFNVPIGAPGGTKDYMNNDVALLLLDRPSTMPVLKLIGNKPKPNNPVADNSPVKVVGWGLTTANGKLAATLQELDMNVLPLSTCQSVWGSVDWDQPVTNNFGANTMMCAAKNYPYRGYGFCAGDSGGPLLVDGGSAANDRQVGIVSWGPANCGAAESSPYVYTDVGAVFTWINQAVFNLTNEWLVPPPAPAPVITNPTLTGFDGRARQLAGAAKTMQGILGYPKRWDLAAYLVPGPAKNTNIIQYVSFNNGTLLVEVGVYTANGALAPVGVTVKGKRMELKPGGAYNTGAGRITFTAVKTGAAKTITINQLGVQVVVTQPWSTLKKKWAPWLNVQATLTQAPAAGVKLIGQLGSTLSATVSGASFTAKKGTVGVTPSAKTLP